MKPLRLFRMLALGALALGLTATPRPAGAQEFSVRWEPQQLADRATALKGYVDNRTQLRVTNVRLRVEALDGAGQVVGQSLGWVLGDVPGGGRGYFTVPLEATGATYRVSVVSYDVVSRGADASGGSASPPSSKP